MSYDKRVLLSHHKFYIPSPLTVSNLNSKFSKASGVCLLPSGDSNCARTYGYAPRTSLKLGSTLSANPSKIVRERIITVKNGGVLNFRTLSLLMASNSACSRLKLTSEPFPVPPVELMNASRRRGTRRSNWVVSDRNPSCRGMRKEC